MQGSNIVSITESRGEIYGRNFVDSGRFSRHLERDSTRGRGGIGRRAGFRFRWRDPWGFESLRPHHFLLFPSSASVFRASNGSHLAASRWALSMK